MSARSRRGDEGIAALEMAVISSLLMLLAFGALPLFAMGHTYQRVNNAAADTVRYATSVDANAHSTTTAAGTTVITRRPTATDVKKFAQAAASDPTLDVTVKVCPDGDLSACVTPADPSMPLAAQSGDTVVITVSKDVDLSLFGSVANAAANLVGQGDIFPHDVRPMSSTASGREE